MANECRNLALEVAAGRLSQEEVDELMAELEWAAKSDPIDGARRKAREIVEDAQLAAKIEKRNRLQNALVEGRLMQMARAADGAAGDPSLGLEAAMVGINTPIDGNLRSVDALANGMMNQYAGGLIADLRRAGLLAKFNKMSGDFEREVARALGDLNRPEPLGVKVSADARAIAKLMQKYQRASVARENRAGAYIRQKSGYVVRQSHDPAKLARAGEARWIAVVRDKLDYEAMGITPDRIEDFLRSAFVSIRSGVRLTQQINDVSRAFTGPGNLAKKDSASRVLEFKDADAWFDYDREFGKGSLREAFMQDLSRAARSAAVMTNFGTNPSAMLDRVTDLLRQEFRHDEKKLARINREGMPALTLEAAMKEISGDVNLGADSSVARVASTFRAVQTMAKLGGSWISALSDIAFVATNRIYQGRSIMDAWADALSASLEGLSGGEKREFADLMGAGLEGQLGDFMSRFNAQDEVAGRTSKLMARFFKLNLLGPWSDANKRGVTFMISRDLARNADRGFDQLPDDLRRMLKSYGFDNRKWNVARLAVREGPDGRTYMMPGDVPSAKGAPFTGLSVTQQDRLRDDVRDSLFALLSNEADFAVPTPGARERAMMRRGYRPGTAAGEAFRFVAQFKSFGVTALTRVIGRSTYGHGAKTLREQLGRGVGQNLGLVNAIVGTTVLGYFVMQAKEVVKGREPRPASAEAFIAAAMQGGGLGIYGDFLFGEANRFGGGTLETIAGPSIGTAAEVIDLLQRARGVVVGGEEDLRGDVIRLAKSNIPFANLFYLKGAMDYMIWYHLQEMVNPGYLRRMERRAKRENDQEYWLPPSDTIRTGGGFR